MSLRHVFAVTALTSALVLGGCQNPDGSTDWGNTLLLGAGIGAAAALVAGAASDDDSRYRGRGRRGYYPEPAYGRHAGYAEPRFGGSPYGSRRW